MFKEVTIIIKGVDSTYKQKFADYEEWSAFDLLKIRGMVDEARSSFKGDIENVIVKIQTVWS